MMITLKRAYDSVSPNGWEALPGRTPVAARSLESEAPCRRVAEGGRTQHGAEKVVQSRSGQVERVSPALLS